MSEKINQIPDDEQLSRLLKGLDDEIEVPFDAAMAWRTAVKREARKMKSRAKFGKMRWVLEAAAAVAIILGATFAFNGFGSAQPNDVVTTIVYRQASAGVGNHAFYTMDNVTEGSIMLAGIDSSNDEGIVTSFDEGTAAKGAMEELPLDQDSETEEDAAQNDYIYFASVNALSKDVKKDAALLNDLVGSTPGAYMETMTSDNENISGVIRVKNEHLDGFLKALENKLNGTVSVETHKISNESSDLTERIESLYYEIDELQLKISQTDDAETLNALNKTLQWRYDEIEEYENLVRKTRYDSEYATVSFIISAQSTLAVAAAGTGSWGGLGLSFIKALAIILPTAVLSVLITLHIQKRRRQSA